MALQFMLIQNRQGKTRLAKWFSSYSVCIDISVQKNANY